MLVLLPVLLLILLLVLLRVLLGSTGLSSTDSPLPPGACAQAVAGKKRCEALLRASPIEALLGMSLPAKLTERLEWAMVSATLGLP